MKQYKVIIFDWDGTLMDSDKRIVACLKEAALRTDLPLLTDADYRHVIGLSLPIALRTLYPEATQWQHQVLETVYRWQYMEANPTPMLPYSGFFELLNTLKEKGIILAVATGKSRPGLDAVLAETASAHFFSITKSGEETAGKPDPLMLTQIIDALGITVDDALMVGDSVYDLDMAQRIGMDALAMTHGVHDASQLAVYHPVAFCDDLMQLKSLLLSC